MRAGTQFTVEQILEAGQRAEAEGRLDYATQFYRHIADQFRGTQEARYASDALARIEQQRPPAAPLVHNGNGADHAPPRLQARPPPSAANGLHLDLGRQVPLAAVETPPREPLELPPPVTDYRLARAAARVAAWLGAPLLLLGLGATAASLMLPGAMAKLPIVGAVLGSVSTGLTLLASGVVIAVVGQVVRAHLEMALAMRDMAALMRAELAAGGATTVDPRSADRHEVRRQRRPKRRT